MGPVVRCDICRRAVGKHNWKSGTFDGIEDDAPF